MRAVGGIMTRGNKYYNGVATGVDIGFVTGDIVQVAVDLDTGKV